MSFGVATIWKIDPDGGVSSVEDTVNFENVAEQIKMLFSTAVGESYNKPTFGHKLADMVHSSVELEDVVDILKFMVQEALANWLPYVAVLKVTIGDREDESIEVTLHYTILGTDFFGEVGVII